MQATSHTDNHAPGIAVIIVNHNSLELARFCIESVSEHHQELSLSFIVLDNGPDDQSAALNSVASNVRCKRLLRNLGFAQAVNEGIDLARKQGFKLALILNPDTFCRAPFISQLVAAFDSAPELAAVSPVILTPNDNVWYQGGCISIIKGGPIHLAGKIGEYSKDLSLQDFVSCCSLLVSIEAFCSVGGLPEFYFLYFEDAEFCIKLRKAGYQLGCVPNARIYHHVSATTDKTSALFTELFARNRIWFMRRNFGLPQYVLFTLVNSLIRLPVALVFFLTVRCSLTNMCAFLRGYFKGLFTNPPTGKKLHDNQGSSPS